MWATKKKKKEQEFKAGKQAGEVNCIVENLEKVKTIQTERDQINS